MTVTNKFDITKLKKKYILGLYKIDSHKLRTFHSLNKKAENGFRKVGYAGSFSVQ